jgi:hypothetical protein
VLLAAVYKSPGYSWNVADITELLSFTHKAPLTGDLNAKHPIWNSVVSNPTCVKLLNLLHTNEIEISAPQCPTHYSFTDNGEVYDVVVHKNVRLSEVIVTYQSFSTCWIILELGIFRTQLTNSQIGGGFIA